MGMLRNLFGNSKSDSDRAGNHALAKAEPLFLIGPPRSGTTMLTRVLNSHPRILLTNETAVLLQLAENVEKSRVGRKAGMIYGKNGGANWANILEMATHQLVGEFYAQLAAEQDKHELAYWGEKHPHFNRCLDFLVEQYPNATYVYAIRDPRDSVCSIAEMNGNGTEAACRLWKKISDIYEKFVADSPAGRRIVTVIYEEFIADYDKRAEAMFGELGVNYTAEARNYIKEYANVDAHTSSAFVFKGAARIKKESRSHDYADKSVGRWKRDLGAKEQQQATGLFRDFIEKYGYSQT